MVLLASLLMLNLLLKAEETSLICSFRIRGRSPFPPFLRVNLSLPLLNLLVLENRFPILSIVSERSRPLL